MIHIKTYLDYLIDIGFLDSYFSNAEFNQEECLVELTISTQTKKKLKYGVRQVFFQSLSNQNSFDDYQTLLCKRMSDSLTQQNDFNQYLDELIAHDEKKRLDLAQAPLKTC